MSSSASCQLLVTHPSCRGTCWESVFPISEGLPKGKVCFFPLRLGIPEGKSCVSSIRLRVLKDSVLSELRARRVFPLRPGIGGIPRCRGCASVLSGSESRYCIFSIKLGLSETKCWDWRFPKGQILSFHPTGGSLRAVSPSQTGGSLKAEQVSPLLLSQVLFWHRNIPERRAGWVLEGRLDRQNGFPTLEKGRSLPGCLPFRNMCD